MLIPLVVALLLFLKWDADKLVFDLRAPNSEPIIIIENLPVAKPLKSLPPIYLVPTQLLQLLLVFAYAAIRRKKVKLHESLMKVSIALSLSFLVMYIAYHITTDPNSVRRFRFDKIYLLFYSNITYITFDNIINSSGFD